MKQIMIKVYDENDDILKGLIEIESEEYVFNYSRTLDHQGLECKHNGDTHEYNQLIKHLYEITEIIKKIENDSKK